jgi:hypothetical protein
MNANILTGTVAAVAPTLDQQVTSSELDQARLYLQQTRNYAIGATKGLSEAQWHFKPSPGCWSIAEIVDHMVVIQELVLGPIREQLARAPAPSADRDYKQVDAIVLNRFSVRLNKFQAPGAALPAGQWPPAVACERLLKNYERLTEYLESTPDLRQHVRESPPLKAVSNGAFEYMDGYQWVLAAAAHTERHTKQILEVKSDPNFPAN